MIKRRSETSREPDWATRYVSYGTATRNYLIRDCSRDPYGSGRKASLLLGWMFFQVEQHDGEERIATIYTLFDRFSLKIKIRFPGRRQG